MSNWQEWVVWILLAFCGVRIIQGGYRFFRRTRRGESPCAGCSQRGGSCAGSRHASCCSEKINKKNDKKRKKNCHG